MISTVALLEKLKNKPLFTLNQLSLITRKQKSYLKVLINRLIKRKLIFRIERNKFSLHDDPLIFSTHIVQPSYISLDCSIFLWPYNSIAVGDFYRDPDKEKTYL